MTGGNRLLFYFTLATAIVVGAVVALATGIWWFLALALVLHALATMLVTALIGRRLDQQDKPGPVTEARLETEPGDDRARPTADRADDDGPRMAI